MYQPLLDVVDVGLGSSSFFASDVAEVGGDEVPGILEDVRVGEAVRTMCARRFSLLQLSILALTNSSWTRDMNVDASS